MDALEELTADGYSFIFVDRIHSLRAHARAKPNIEGLVYLNVRHFVHGLQRRQDPLGARIYSLVQEAVGDLVENGILTSGASGERLTGESVLTFRVSEDSSEATEVAEEEALEQQIERWPDTLLPDLVTTRGRGHGPLKDRLCDHLLAFRGGGVKTFTLGAVVRSLNTEVRRRWAAILDTSQGEKRQEFSEDGVPAWVPISLPDETYAERQSFRWFAECTDLALSGFVGDERTREELRVLWEALLSWVAEPSDISAGEKGASSVRGREGIPSRRELARFLGIPRGRLPRLYEHLGGIVNRCKEKGPGALSKSSIPSRSTSVGGSMDSGQIRDQLRQATGEAVVRSAQALDRPHSHSSEDPRPGEIFVLRESGPEPIEWLVVEVSSTKDGRWIGLPVDTYPWIGPGDIGVPREAPGGPLNLRCALAVSLPQGLFEAALRSGSLAPSYLKEAKAKSRELSAARIHSGGQGELEPADREWRQKLVEAVRRVQEAGAAPEETPRLSCPKRSESHRFSHWSSRLAATFAAISLGLAWWGWTQRQQLEELSAPSFAPPREEVVFENDPQRGPELWQVPAGGKPLLVNLVFRETAACDLLRLEFRDRHGCSLWTTGEFAVPVTDEVRLVLPSGFLRRGPVELELSGRCEARWIVLEQLELRIGSS